MRSLLRKAGVTAAYLGLMLTAVVLSTPLLECASVAAVQAGHDKFKDRGNLWKSGNYRVRGRQVNSGNWDNANAAINSDFSINGSNFANGPQYILNREGISKLAH
ncbi:hypothetical protein ITP53_05910 [Nonomuraea sp. K274]|uniref:Uncharacterized protein n=1 Tax=Nonomuraea cypriaca TaxID=1187855 RepID=A0A931A2Y5_9ACTN|nr:hypothetical protein [Nonomuraea cypriaca]MBF8185277.1 hypothetical protein [Nonomuraea cypriaca]